MLPPSDLKPMLNIRLILKFGLTSDVTLSTLLLFRSLIYVLKLKSLGQIFKTNIFLIELL